MSVPSIIKWTGSKRRFASHIAKLFPSGGSFYEPFLGGGAVLLEMKGRHHRFGSDIYKPLIDLWRKIQSDPIGLADDYKVRWHQLQSEIEQIDPTRDKGKMLPEIFYRARDQFNEDGSPECLLFLTRTCVNGVIRFSTAGRFNNSFHHGRPGINPETLRNNLLAASRLVADVQFLCEPAEMIVSRVRSGDVVYLDPPYQKSTNRYIRNFAIDELLRLINALNDKGCHWILSYDETLNDKAALPQHLFSKHFQMAAYDSKIRSISKANKKAVTESLYCNF